MRAETLTTNATEACAGRVRGDLIMIATWLVLIAAAVGVGRYYNTQRPDVHIWAPAAPIYGHWEPHIGPGTPAAILLALLVIIGGPALAARMPWRSALALTYAGALGWTFSLAMIDGWEHFTTRLTSRFEYLSEVPGVTNIPVMLQEFADRILVGQPDNWAVHVSGHPPGALLVYVWLDRIGLSGGTWASIVTVLIGCLFAVAVPVTIAALGSADAARRGLPFVVLFPGAVWVGVSADGLFAGVTATGIAALALATRASGWRLAALAATGGLLLGFGLFLSYGFVLLGPLALAVLIYRRAWQALLIGGAVVVAVVAVFAVAGFWWLDGYFLVVERYYQDLGTIRPYSFWVWANLASLAIVIGPATAVALRRGALSAFRSGLSAPVLLAAGGLVAIIFANVSGLSKAETERIWLPFAIWLLAVVALLPAKHVRWLLAGQAATALTVNHLLLTVW